MILAKVRSYAAEKIDLQARDAQAPNDGSRPHKVRLPTPRRATVKHLCGAGLVRDTLLMVEVEVQWLDL